MITPTMSLEELRDRLYLHHDYPGDVFVLTKDGELIYLIDVAEVAGQRFKWYHILQEDGDCFIHNGTKKKKSEFQPIKCLTAKNN